MSLGDIGELIPEKKVYEDFDHLLNKDELLAARKAGVLGFYQLGRTIAYTMEQLVAYFETKRRDPCQNRQIDESPENPVIRTAFSKFEGNGSARSRGGKPGPAIGGSREMDQSLAESAASHWEPRI